MTHGRSPSRPPPSLLPSPPQPPPTSTHDSCTHYPCTQQSLCRTVPRAPTGAPVPAPPVSPRPAVPPSSPPPTSAHDSCTHYHDKRFTLLQHMRHRGEVRFAEILEESAFVPHTPSLDQSRELFLDGARESPDVVQEPLLQRQSRDVHGVCGHSEGGAGHDRNLRFAGLLQRHLGEFVNGRTMMLPPTEGNSPRFVPGWSLETVGLMSCR